MGEFDLDINWKEFWMDGRSFNGKYMISSVPLLMELGNADFSGGL